MPGPRLFTVNLPVGVPAADQCGKGVHIDATLQGRGQRFIEIAFVGLTAVSAEISPSTPNCDRIDIDRVHIDRAQRHG